MDLEDLRIRKRQTSMTSDFPDLIQTKFNPLIKHMLSLRPNILSSPSNEYGQQTSVGNENPNMIEEEDSIKKPLNHRKLNGKNNQNMISMSVRECCINGDCYMLKDGERCSIGDYFVSNLN